MSVADLERAAELTKLARLLGVDETELEFLHAVSASAIREFRYTASDRLFASDGDKLKRIAAAAKLVPAPVAAKAAALAFGPLLTAAVASSVEPARGIAVANNLRVAFLAKTAAELDPRRCGPILSELPPKLAGKVAAQLIDADEQLTLGRFVGAVSDDALRAAVAELTDADLLQVAFLLEDRSAVDHVIDVVGDRLPGVLIAAGTEGLWSQALGLLDSIDDRHRTTMGDLAAQLDPELIAGLIHAVHESQAWGTLLPVTRAMSADSLRTFAAHPEVSDPLTVAAVMDAALSEEMWLDLLPLAAELPTPAQTFLAGRIVELEPDVLDDLLKRTDDADLWAALLPLVAVMDEEQVAGLLKQSVLSDVDVMTRVLEVLDAGTEVPADLRTLVVDHGVSVGVRSATSAQNA